VKTALDVGKSQEAVTRDGSGGDQSRAYALRYQLMAKKNFLFKKTLNRLLFGGKEGPKADAREESSKNSPMCEERGEERQE